MKATKLHFFALILGTSLTLTACHKDKDEPDPVTPTAERKGLYVLSEGDFSATANNSSLTYYNYADKALTPNLFQQANSRSLGSLAVDAQVYGAKMYIAVDLSGTVEVVNARTGKSIKQIDMKNAGLSREPRSLAFYKNKAYVSLYDGNVAVIDTTSLTVDKYIKVGRSPEGIAVANGKLYVANSGGFDYPNYDNTVSVIDLTTGTETKKITVVANPGRVAADKYGDVYVLSQGNYGTIAPSMAIINSATDAVTSQKNFTGGKMVISGDFAYILDGKAVKVYNVKTETVEKANFITDGTTFTATYGLAYDELSGEVFVTDAKNFVANGEVVCFGADGKKKYAIAAGLNPNNVIFINK